VRRGLRGCPVSPGGAASRSLGREPQGHGAIPPESFPKPRRGDRIPGGGRPAVAAAPAGLGGRGVIASGPGAHAPGYGMPPPPGAHTPSSDTLRGAIPGGGSDPGSEASDTNHFDDAGAVVNREEDSERRGKERAQALRDFHTFGRGILR